MASTADEEDPAIWIDRVIAQLPSERPPLANSESVSWSCHSVKLDLNVRSIDSRATAGCSAHESSSCVDSSGTWAGVDMVERLRALALKDRLGELQLAWINWVVICLMVYYLYTDWLVYTRVLTIVASRVVPLTFLCIMFPYEEDVETTRSTLCLSKILGTAARSYRSWPGESIARALPFVIMIVASDLPFAFELLRPRRMHVHDGVWTCLPRHLRRTRNIGFATTCVLWLSGAPAQSYPMRANGIGECGLIILVLQLMVTLTSSRENRVRLSSMVRAPGMSVALASVSASRVSLDKVADAINDEGTDASDESWRGSRGGVAARAGRRSRSPPRRRRPR